MFFCFFFILQAPLVMLAILRYPTWANVDTDLSHQIKQKKFKNSLSFH